MVSNAGDGAVISSSDGGGWKTMLASKKAQRTLNPIRAIMDPIMATAPTRRDDGKSQISLAVSSATRRTKSFVRGFVLYFMPSPFPCINSLKNTNYSYATTNISKTQSLVIQQYMEIYHPVQP